MRDNIPINNCPSITKTEEEDMSHKLSNPISVRLITLKMFVVNPARLKLALNG